MIVVMKKGAPKQEIELLSGWLEHFNVTVNPIIGAETTILGLVGDTSAIDKDTLMLNHWVDRVMKVQEPFKRANRAMHPDDTVVNIGGVEVGVFGQVHPLVAKNYGIDSEIYAAELDFTALSALLCPPKTFHPLPKYPTVNRDIAVVCDESVTVAQLVDCIRSAGGKLLRSVQLFDIYRGKGIDAGKKSVAFSLTLRSDERTLTDADSDGEVKAVLEKLEADLGARLR